MRKVWMPLLLFLLPTFVFADSASEEIKQLQERVKQLEQKQQIESLKIRVKELEQEKSENKHSTIRPFLGGMVGGWGENNYNLATSFSLGGSAGLSLKYGGGSVSNLYYKRNSVQMIPVMFNIYGRIPFNNVDKAEVFAVRIGWGLNYANASSDLYSVKSGWGSQLNIGTDIWISDNVSIGADVFYMFVFAQYYYVYENAYYGNSIDAYASFIGLVSLKYHFL